MLVDVGHRVEMLTEGSRSPTVVLESGFGATIDFWQKVQGPVSSLPWWCLTSALEWASRNWQAPHGRQRAPARELLSALRAAHLAPPYLIVGHSIGSFDIRVFARTYPNDVCGMVFVDPVPEDFYEWMRAHQAEDWLANGGSFLSAPRGLRNERWLAPAGGKQLIRPRGVCDTLQT
jgi:pimeloyl-ACP methyl ester carboxylesterase